MITPTATYRLQFRNGMDFARAVGLVSYLSRLGISHLYASPLFSAVPGSTHGYDGIDFSRIEPEIGGEPGFELLSGALDAAGLGLILDFVPNHMAATEANRWWRSILEWGSESPVAGTFDIDWSAPKLLLPMLGVAYDQALEEGLFGITFDSAAGGFDFSVYERRIPLSPRSYGQVLERVAAPPVAGLAVPFAGAGPEGAAALKGQLLRLAEEPDLAAAIAKVTTAASGDRDLLDRLHEAQPWRLVDWRRGRKELAWRRFFEICDLVGLRVEVPTVFDAVHARLSELVAGGRVDGVRLDHIDGLADPKAYLERLQRSVGGTYLLVEKILEPGERLRTDWPVAGTTGYEFIESLAGLFVDRGQESAMTIGYAAFCGASDDYAEAVRSAKRQTLEYNLAAEVSRLVDSARRHPASRPYDEVALRSAIIALAVAIPVYRTYVDADGPQAGDRRLIDSMAHEATKATAGQAGHAEAIQFLAGLLRLEDEGPEERAAALQFAIHFQQVTGPVMAKAVEDTVFYRYNRLISLNEVGGAPTRYGARRADFHAAMADRRQRHPTGLSATSTHDTKRGEDARARLYALSEGPAEWSQSVWRWSDLNAGHRSQLPDGVAPEPPMEWMFYQSLAGMWPAELIDLPSVGTQGAELAAIRDRMRAYMTKAVREAKRRTSWIDPDPIYEKAIDRFVDGVLSPAEGYSFRADFVQTCRPFWIAGAINAISQLAIKLCAPGVPDFYQGSEIWDFSLVDPDNRLAVDFAARRRMLQSDSGRWHDDLLSDWCSGTPKMALTVAGLAMRAGDPELFTRGGYIPLEVFGVRARHVVAFARVLDSAISIVVAPRLVYRLIDGMEEPLVPPERWGDTGVAIPFRLHDHGFRDIVTGYRAEAADRLFLADLLRRFPAAILVTSEV